ncbi:hypothetical protein TeGR_g9331, partial [Tetraparma gracilis]
PAAPPPRRAAPGKALRAVSPPPPPSSKRKRVSTRLFNEPSFPDLLEAWEANSLPLGAWSMGMHSLLRERFPGLLRKYGYFEADKKVHLCQYLFEKSNKRKAEGGKGGKKK